MVIIILPAYNEAPTLSSLFQAVAKTMKGKNYRIVLVDDGSTDRTLELAVKYSDKISLEVIQHQNNEGLGKAIKTGIFNVINTVKDCDIVVTLDADNTHNPQLILSMQKYLENDSDIVIASRYQIGGKEIGLSFYRSFLSKAVNTVLKILFPLKGVKDYTCGYRAYKGWVLKEGYRLWGGGLIEEKGFICMAELLIKLSRISVNISEVPLVLRYDLKEGKSKMKITKTILQYLLFILKAKLKPYKRKII
ncbi:glycosyltransferase family 2 protein [bacterium]|nr:glycosyltransferase family 2 protein [bacterium]